MHAPLLQLLTEQGIDPNAQQIIVMRHADRKKYRLEKYVGTRPFVLYQAVQPTRMPVGSYLVSFFGHRPGHGLLLGVWRVNNVMPAGEAVRKGLTEGSFEPLTPDWPGYYHELQETGVLADLRLKLEIAWPGKELNWRQIASGGRQPQNRVRFPASVRSEPAVPFRGLTGASLVMAELRAALQDMTWQKALCEAAGVYLITDERTGNQYVGSACGRQGFLGRWAEYAFNGHGGNKKLIQLLEGSPGRELDFRFTILEVASTGAGPREVLAREAYWKIALGSRAFGLNLN